MKYKRLIALQVDDFCSTIVSEKNYGLDDTEILKVDKSCLENDGCVCIIVEMISNLTI